MGIEFMAAMILSSACSFVLAYWVGYYTRDKS